MTIYFWRFVFLLTWLHSPVTWRSAFCDQKRNKIPELCNLSLASIQAISWIAAEYLTPLISQQSDHSIHPITFKSWNLLRQQHARRPISEEFIILKPIDFCDPSMIRILTSLASSSLLYIQLFQEKKKDLSTKIEILTTNWSVQSLNATIMNLSPQPISSTPPLRRLMMPPYLLIHADLHS